jgi:hypothetical protein
VERVEDRLSFFDSSDSLCAVVVIDVEVALIRWPQKGGFGGYV